MAFVWVFQRVQTNSGLSDESRDLYVEWHLGNRNLWERWRKRPWLLQGQKHFKKTYHFNTYAILCQTPYSPVPNFAALLWSKTSIKAQNIMNIYELLLSSYINLKGSWCSTGKGLLLVPSSWGFRNCITSWNLSAFTGHQRQPIEIFFSMWLDPCISCKNHEQQQHLAATLGSAMFCIGNFPFLWNTINQTCCMQALLWLSRKPVQIAKPINQWREPDGKYL